MTHAPGCVHPVGRVTDVMMIAQLNERLISANAKLETAATKIRDLQREVSALMCWQVGAFVDGELDAERAEAFRGHLSGCANCRQESLDLMTLTERLLELRSL